jgi:hypothetical protein
MRIALLPLSRTLPWLSRKLTVNFSSELKHTELAGIAPSVLVFFFLLPPYSGARSHIGAEG